MSTGMAEVMAGFVAKQETPEGRSHVAKWMEWVRWNIDEDWRDPYHLLVKVEAARIRIQGNRGAFWMQMRGYHEPSLADVDAEVERQRSIFGW